MGFFGVLLLVIFVLVCLLLIFLVVIQDEDSDSIGGIFAGGSASAFGSRSTSVVIKITYILGAIFFVSAFALAIVNKSSSGNVVAAAQNSQSTTSTEWWKGDQASSTTVAGQPTPTTISPATTVPTQKK